MALIDIHVPDEDVVNLLRRERALRVGDGTVTEIQVVGSEVTVTISYELAESMLRELALR